MRQFIDIITALNEGEVVDLGQHKQDKAISGYRNAMQGIYNSESEFFASGKFAPFAKTYIDSGFNAEFAPIIELRIRFRDDRPMPTVRALKQELRQQRFKISAAHTWAKGYKPKANTQQDHWGGWADKTITMPVARDLFANRAHSAFGAYQPSRSGFRTDHKNLWDERGVGFNIVVGGHDSRRGERGYATREEHHVIDDENDMQEVSQMFALIQRARMAIVR
jgi:hypothetical protein